jgi:hypothetical protein
MKAVAVAFSMAWLDAPVEDGTDSGALELLAAFRGGLYGCFTARADALFELTEALLCADGPVRTLVGLSLAPEHQRGHGALYGRGEPRADRHRAAAQDAVGAAAAAGS